MLLNFSGRVGVPQKKKAEIGNRTFVHCEYEGFHHAVSSGIIGKHFFGGHSDSFLREVTTFFDGLGVTTPEATFTDSTFIYPEFLRDLWICMVRFDSISNILYQLTEMIWGSFWESTFLRKRFPDFHHLLRTVTSTLRNLSMHIMGSREYCWWFRNPANHQR